MVIVSNGDRIIYTLGYSWENDVWNANILYEIINDISGNSQAKTKIKSEITNCSTNFVRNIKWAVRADVVLCQNNKSLLMNRSPDSMISLDARKKPSFNRKEILRLLHIFNQEKNQKYYMSNDVLTSPLRDCCGHTIAIFFYRVFCYINKHYIKKPNIAKYYLNTIAISKFIDLINKGKMKKFFNHYEKQLRTKVA